MELVGTRQEIVVKVVADGMDRRAKRWGDVRDEVNIALKIAELLDKGEVPYVAKDEDRYILRFDAVDGIASVNVGAFPSRVVLEIILESFSFLGAAKLAIKELDNGLGDRIVIKTSA